MYGVWFTKGGFTIHVVDDGEGTVGKATYTPAKAGESGWASTYITIWHRQPDGSWKVLFDTGRVVNR